jgi:hypothetical protein
MEVGETNVESFIDNVPSVAVAPVVICLVFNVVLEDFQEFGLGEVSIVQPIRELLVPEESMAAAHLAGFFAWVYDLVA